MTRTIDELFPKGLLRPELFVGVASSISARSVSVNLSEAGRPSGSHFSGGRYGRGEVGEFVLIEAQQNLLLGRITEVRLPDQERRSIKPNYVSHSDLDAIGQIQLLGCVGMDDLLVTAGVDSYPRLGDRVYAAPHRFIALLPRLMEIDTRVKHPVLLNLGSVDAAQDSTISIKPEKIFGRHCAILGATGGGKSWTTARIIEECIQHKSKIILLDATSEYRDITGIHVEHCHLGDPVEISQGSVACALPPTSFIESDFIALFEPAGKVQGPKMRAAIKSLRLATLMPELAQDGVIRKYNQSKAAIEEAERNFESSSKLDDPRQSFNVVKLVQQIEQECVWPTGGTSYNQDPSKWGNRDDSSYSNCLSLFARINGVLTSSAFKCVFSSQDQHLTTKISDFQSSDKRLLRICLSGVAHEFNAREIIANAIGRNLLSLARQGSYKTSPVVVIVDEAHNFLGRKIGSEDYFSKLDSFEIIAKEGRKYGLNICLATQRPRDVTEGVLSQMGTLIVHRLTNDRDREVVERACGEIDRSASAFLPNLKPGEAAIIGADFPIPLTIQINPPTKKPKSDGPNFQDHWQKDIENETVRGRTMEAPIVQSIIPIAVSPIGKGEDPPPRKLRKGKTAYNTRQ